MWRGLTVGWWWGILGACRYGCSAGVALSRADKGPRIKIDNASGVSNNTKVSYKAKDKTAEQVLNELCDKLDCGWYVVSNAANNKVDGSVVIRKSTKGKERGYEAGKEPKKKAEAVPPQLDRFTGPVLTASRTVRSPSPSTPRVQTYT